MFDNETQERIDRFMKVRVDEGLKIDPETVTLGFERGLPTSITRPKTRGFDERSA